MGSHKYSLALLELSNDLTLPVRHHALDDDLEALSLGDFVRGQARILGLGFRVEWTVSIDFRRRQIETSAPDLHLLSTVLDDGLLFVQARQSSVHALVQTPCLGTGACIWSAFSSARLQVLIARFKKEV